MDRWIINFKMDTSGKEKARQAKHNWNYELDEAAWKFESEDLWGKYTMESGHGEAYSKFGSYWQVFNNSSIYPYASTYTVTAVYCVKLAFPEMLYSHSPCKSLFPTLRWIKLVIVLPSVSFESTLRSTTQSSLSMKQLIGVKVGVRRWSRKITASCEVISEFLNWVPFSCMR